MLTIDWVSVEEYPPVPGVGVLLSYVNEAGKRRTVVGHYMTAHTQECSPESELDLDYDEETDTFFEPAGWYVHCEWHPDYSHWLLGRREAPTHWMPLPEAP